MMQRAVVFSALLLMAAGCATATPTHGLGAVIEGDVQDPAVKAAAAYVLERANTNNCNGLCASLKRNGDLKLVEILSVKTQVVAGTLYKMELLMEDTKGQQMLFTTTVWSRPWLAASNSEEANHITKFHFQYVEP